MLRPTPRDFIWLGIGSLAYPLGTALVNILDHRGLLYPKEKT